MRASSVAYCPTRYVGIVTTLLLLAPLIAVTACKSPASDEAGGNAPPALTLLAPESAEWSRGEAVAHLDDPNLAVSAAIRLLRWHDAEPLCIAGKLSDPRVRELRVVKLADECWVIGQRDRSTSSRLWSPALITADGEVTYQVDDGRDEILVVHIAQDSEVFPHLAIFADRVWSIRAAVEPSLVLQPGQEGWFELATEEGYSYVALVWPQDGAVVEVARYTWDPWEHVFAGPLMNRLPAEPERIFRIDLESSANFIPEGGLIREPDPVEDVVPVGDNLGEPA